ncbi:hypothetical protein HG597_20195 [Klebsiella sp. DNRA6]|uniref:hypothetical protein n=1 Tax=Klebsiella sp. DNRA6 TaxID=2723057 RepID=UPI001472A404|nr:hypothetical protein [Klebsiella sp. DNRA6]NMD81427.1 hypothetical protein [Klebsiella sp. DNRA6]
MTTYNNALFSEKAFPKYWNLPDDISGRILVGGFHNLQNECYYLIDFHERKINCCIINVATYAAQMSLFLKKNLKLAQLPYGSASHESAVYNFLQPHEGLELKNGLIAMAMHNASYTRLLNFEQKYVSAFTSKQEFIPEMVSATNSVDSNGEHYYYSISDMNQRMAMYRGERSSIDTYVYKTKVKLQDSTLIKKINTSEVIHEVKVSPDKNGIAMTEFCLTAKGPLPPRHDRVFLDYDEWNQYEKLGLHKSPMYLINEDTKHHTTLCINDKTPGHIEFQNIKSNEFWLSCHNLSKAYGKLILHGQGELIHGVIENDEIFIRKKITDNSLYRVTSHKVFLYNGKEYMVVTSFPDSFYIYDTQEREFIKKVELYQHDRIEPNKLYFCTLHDHIPLWIETSDNGRYVILVSNTVLYIYDLKTFNLTAYAGWSFNGGFIGTAHITNMNDFPH